ncbi:MAG: hypothetical protein P8Q14_04880 [Vicingaceae bacterium]|nr:hypothetical protein [Vicingaceae bacterium]
MESKQVVLEEVKLGTIIIEDYNAAVLDLTHVNHSYESLELDPIDGVLGSDILADYKAVIDYDKSRLILSEL